MTGERIALRPDSNGDLDDVVVRDVSMFRAEMMDDKNLWMCCYIDGEQVTFWVRSKKGKIDFTVTDSPPAKGAITYEPGSM